VIQTAELECLICGKMLELGYVCAPRKRHDNARTRASRHE